MRGQGRRAVQISADGDDAFPVTGQCAHTILNTFARHVGETIDLFGDGGEYAVWYADAATSHNAWGPDMIPWILDDIDDYLARRTP
jgi:hypothetical protein